MYRFKYRVSGNIYSTLIFEWTLEECIASFKEQLIDIPYEIISITSEIID